MSHPAEFNYINEDDFIQKFLIPLLSRLGFHHVVNYHGNSEFGKDLVFAEIDRFGHVIYHGLQAKYEPSISLAMSDDLIRDCKQAFANPFRHPSTGASENISTFYAVNGGSISEQGTTNFFNGCRLIGRGANVRLLDGKALVALDRSASINRGEMVGETLTGLLLEIRHNRLLTAKIIDLMEKYMIDPAAPMPMERLRGQALRNYLVRPICQTSITTEIIDKMLVIVDCINFMLDHCRLPGASHENKVELAKFVINIHNSNMFSAYYIEAQILAILSSLGPLSGI